MSDKEITLYNYTHCPYCLRVRMAFGFLSIPFNSKIVSYEDEITPVQLIGKKMLPIVVDAGIAMCESLDIIQKYDSADRLQIKNLGKEPIAELDKELSHFGELIHSLCMPYWIFTPEFGQQARGYFQTKKEKKRGPFRELVGNRIIFQTELEKRISEFEGNIDPFYRSHTISIKDIMIASHFWGLYILPEFQFSLKFHNYLQTIKRLTHFTYWDHFVEYL